MTTSLRSMTGSLAMLAVFLFTATASAQEARVIVKLRESAAILKQAHAQDRARSLSARLGVPLIGRSEAAPRMHAMRARGITTDELVAQLRADPDVEYAVADRLRDARALPNDPLYGEQWYLQSTEISAINAEGAWDVSTGSASVVVAVLDTGVRAEHPDLAAHVLPGYDFIADAALAGDGDGRDADASDSGDFIDAAAQADAELQAVCGPGLALQDSSWHGTRVAGVIAAAGNNSVGISGVNWSGRILPVRVLGKCGGFDSDIIAAMRWAAGLSVAGVPDNPNPARILNVSLGGDGACTAAYQDVIDEIRAAGALVVASAGNETGPVESPGNCPGVMTVAGVRHIGTKVGYSSMGSEVGISAPAGNCVNSFLPCLFPIDTTSNAGTTTPGASNYTDGNNPNIGTSFSTPQVAGVAALMLAVNPALAPDDLIARLRTSARPFPTDATIPVCPTTATGVDNTGQCNCTTLTCGAGLLDAAAALAAAAPPAAAITSSGDATAGETLTLDAASSSASPGRRIVAWLWSLLSSPAGSGASLSATDTETTTLQPPVSGTYVVALTVTDELGATDQAVLSIQVSAASAPADPADDDTANAGDDGDGDGDEGGGGSGGGGATDPLTLLMLFGAAAAALGSRRHTRSSGAAGDRSSG